MKAMVLKRLAAMGKKGERVDLMRLGKALGDRIDRLAHDVFVAHRNTLFHEHATFIVPAVWGGRQEGSLSEVQREIHARVEPVVRELLACLDIEDASPEQHFAVEFLIRELIITKITFMLELGKNMGLARPGKEPKEKHPLTDMEPLGRA